MITRSGVCSRVTRRRPTGRWPKRSACLKRWERRGSVWRRLKPRKRFAPLARPWVKTTCCREDTFPSAARVDGRTLFLYRRVFVEDTSGDILGWHAVFASLYLETQRFDTGIAGGERCRKIGNRGGVGIGVARCRRIVFRYVQPSGVGLGSFLRLRGAIQIID